MRRDHAADHSDHAHVDEVTVGLWGPPGRTLMLRVVVPTGQLLTNADDGRALARTLLEAVHDLERIERGQPPVRGVDVDERNSRGRVS